MDFLKAIRSIPNAFHVMLQDAESKEHDAVLASSNFDREAGQFGITQRGQDALFVALPFDIPKGGKVIYIEAGNEVRRRVDNVSACPYFLQISLGENC